MRRTESLGKPSIKRLALLACMFIYATAFAEEDVLQVKLPLMGVHDPDAHFPFELLDLALQKTGRAYNITYVSAEEERASGKSEEDLIRTNDPLINVVIHGTSVEKEERMRAVYFPIYGGLLGYRVFAIREGDQPKFDAIQYLPELRAMVALQGEGWADAELLREDGYRVATAPVEELFLKLLNGTGDYFPRGVVEVDGFFHDDDGSHDGLALEKKLYLKYDFALYYFVNRDNDELHDAIYEGLMAAHQDGSYLKLLQNSNEAHAVFDHLNFPQRKGFLVNNPSISKRTREIPAEYWLTIDDLEQTRDALVDQ